MGHSPPYESGAKLDRFIFRRFSPTRRDDSFRPIAYPASLVSIMNIALQPGAGRVCPQCGNETPEEQGLRRWCDQCDWNVAAPRVIEDEGFFSRRYAAIGERRGKSLLAALHALLMHLLWRVKQRSEYFADYLAATIAGTPATVDLLDKIALGEHLDAVLLRHAFSTAQSGDYILGLFRDRIASLPSRELERLRRASNAEGAQLDSTHPPTKYRKAFLDAHAIAEPQLAVEVSAMDAIDAELRRLTNKLGGRLIARYARD